MEAKKRKYHGGLPRGPPHGAKLKSRPAGFWYSLCQKKMSTESFKRMSNASFLRSSESGDEVTGTQSEQVSFSCYMKKFKKGTLEPRAKMKSKESKYMEFLQTSWLSIATIKLGFVSKTSVGLQNFIYHSTAQAPTVV